MSRRPKRDLVLGLHASSKGLGWVAFEGPLAVYDWALFTARWDKNRRCVARVASLIRRLQPQVLILEAFDEPKSRRSARVRRLYKSLIRLAADTGVHVEIYGRDEVAACFAEMGAVTRQEIAAAVVRRVDGFEYRLPPKRRAWMSEDPRLALFSAAALALTHYRQEAELVLRAVRRPAPIVEGQGRGLRNRREHSKPSH